MRDGALIGPIIIAIGLVLAALIFAVVGTLLETADGSTELRLGRNEAKLQEMDREVGRLRDALSQAQSDLEKLAKDVAAAPAPSKAPIVLPAGQIDINSAEEEHTETEALTEEMLLAKSRFNKGVSQPRNRIMLEILGHPRSSYSTNCQPVTNPRLRNLLKTEAVGPIRVTMIEPALASLRRIMARLQESDPDIYRAVGTAGALCARLIRGSSRSVSNHSWGTAIDVKLEGKLDGFGDGGTQFGLLIIAELFNEEGWYWGATYNREDSMHFEVGIETLRKWQAEGHL